MRRLGKTIQLAVTDSKDHCTPLARWTLESICADPSQHPQRFCRNGTPARPAAGERQHPSPRIGKKLKTPPTTSRDGERIRTSPDDGVAASARTFAGRGEACLNQANAGRVLPCGLHSLDILLGPGDVDWRTIARDSLSREQDLKIAAYSHPTRHTQLGSCGFWQSGRGRLVSTGGRPGPDPYETRRLYLPVRAF